MEYFEEGKKMDKIKEVGSKAKDIGSKAASWYNNGLNKRADALAKVVVKCKDKSDAKLYEKYKKDLIRWKATYKVGELATLAAVGTAVPFVPMELVPVTILGTMKKSEDEVDQAVIKKYDALKTKAKTFTNKLNVFKKKAKDKNVDPAELEREFNSLDVIAADMARQHDTLTNASVSNSTSKPMSESVSETIMETVENVLYDDGKITNESFEAVKRFIDRADYTNERDVLIIETCINILNKYTE